MGDSRMAVAVLIVLVVVIAFVAYRWRGDTAYMDGFADASMFGGMTDSMHDSMPDSMHSSVDDSMSDSAVSPAVEAAGEAVGEAADEAPASYANESLDLEGDAGVDAAVSALKGEDHDPDNSETIAESRDQAVLGKAMSHAATRERMAPAAVANRTNVWGGGLRRMTDGGVGPRREDEHYYSSRYVPIGFARYESPMVDPDDYKFYAISGWRVAIPRGTQGPEVRALLQRIYHYGPRSAGYARIGDTIVPAILGPGDRQVLATSSSRLGPASRKYPLA